jgi:hypothetical protein
MIEYRTVVHPGGVERGTRNLTFGVPCTICEGHACDIAAVTVGIPRDLSKSRQQSPGTLEPPPA